MMKMSIIIKISAVIGLAALPTQSAETNKDIPYKTELSENPYYASREKPQPLDKQTEAPVPEDTFDTEAHFNAYLDSLEQYTNKQLTQSNMPDIKLPEKGIGNLEIDFIGSTRFFFVRVNESTKYAVSTHVSDIIDMAGIKKTDIDTLDGRRVIYKLPKKVEKMSYRDKTYRLARILSFLDK